MTVGLRHAIDHLSRLLSEGSLESLAQRMKPRTGNPAPHIQGGPIISPEAMTLTQPMTR